MEQASSSVVVQCLPPLTAGEFQCYIGIWILVLSCSGWSQNDFWSSREYYQKINACPFNFKDKWARRTLMLSLRCHNLPDSVHLLIMITYVKFLWWSENWIITWWIYFFHPGLFVLMKAIWQSIYICPGWVICPQKPHPLGNEDHSMCLHQWQWSQKDHTSLQMLALGIIKLIWNKYI